MLGCIARLRFPAHPPPSFRVSGFWFLVSDFWFRVSGFGLRVSDFGSRVSDFGLRISGFGFRVSSFELHISGVVLRVSGIRFRVSCLGLRVSGFGLRASGFGFRVSGERGWERDGTTSPVEVESVVAVPGAPCHMSEFCQFPAITQVNRGSTLIGKLTEKGSVMPTATKTPPCEQGTAPRPPSRLRAWLPCPVPPAARSSCRYAKISRR